MIKAASAAMSTRAVDDNQIRVGIQAVLDLITIGTPAFRVYYRSLTERGIVWAESSNPADFPHKDLPAKWNGTPERLTYQKLEIDTMTSGWQEWTP